MNNNIPAFEAAHIQKSRCTNCKGATSNIFGKNIDRGKTQHRSQGLDLLKTIAIFFVITYHAECGAYVQYGLGLHPTSIIMLISYYLLGIMSTCVPIFFLVNGALLFNKPFHLRDHIKKTVGIICITLIWNIITQAALSIMGTVQPVSFVDLVHNIVSLQAGLNNHLWFMYALVVIYCFFPLLKLAYDHSQPIFLTFLCIATICTFGVTFAQNIIDVAQLFVFGNVGNQCQFNLLGDFNPFRGIYGWSFVYFMIGGLAVSNNIRETLRQSRYRKLAIAIFLLSACCYFLFNLMFLYRGIAVTDIVFGGYNNCWVLIMTCSLYVLIEPVHLTPGFAHIITYIGRGTLGLYFVHWIVIAALHACHFSVSPRFGYTIFPYLFTGILLMTTCAVICWGIQHIPFLKRLITL